jgi:methionyl-tRNA formyltransferase
MVTSLRLVFLGTPAFAVPSLESLVTSSHTLVGVVTQPDRPRGRGQRVRDAEVKTAAIRHGLPVFQPDTLRSPEVESRLRAWAPDLGIVAAYGKLIPDALLKLPRLGMINVHASLLPRHRGAAPIHRAVMAGDSRTGVTIMRVMRELDAGEILARIERAIAPHETALDVERALAVLGSDILLTVIDHLAAGTAREVPQDAAHVSYARRITRDEGRIDWSRPARTIHDQVRGLHPWPHAFTTLAGRRLIVRRTRVIPDDAQGRPGTVTSAHKGYLEVATGAGTIAVEELQPEGRRPMPARDFLAGHPVSVGTTLGLP